MRKKLSFTFQFFQHKAPVFAVGFLRSTEFIIVLWFVDFRIAWGY